MSNSRSLTDLPIELQYKIILENTDFKTLKAFNKVSTELNTFFQPYLNVAKFVQDVANGDLPRVKHALQIQPEMLFIKTVEVIDPSERTFKNMSGLQYAAWALDTMMLNMMLEISITNETQRQLAVTQLQELETNKTAHGAHFDLSRLINTLKNYNDNHMQWNDRQRIKNWINNVGGAQSRLPAHMAFEYCNEKYSFYPTPKFYNKDSAIRDNKGKSASLNIVNAMQENLEWYPLLPGKGIGIHYGIYKGNEKKPLAVWRPSILQHDVNLDIAAMQTLKEVREAEYYMIFYNLKHPEKQIRSANKI